MTKTHEGECVGKCGSPVTPFGAMCPDCIVGARILNRNAGLRRAQELAWEHLAGDYVGFNRAIDAEAAKERT